MLKRSVPRANERRRVYQLIHSCLTAGCPHKVASHPTLEQVTPHVRSICIA